MAEPSQLSRAEQLKQKPELPSMYIVFGGVLALSAFMFAVVWHGLVITLAALIFLSFLLLVFTCYFAYTAHVNKQKLYTMYEEMKKLAETQSHHAKEAESTLDELREASPQDISSDQKMELISQIVSLYLDHKEREQKNVHS